MNRIRLSRALILSAALAVAAHSSHAQPITGEIPDANAAQAIKTVDIKVRNIPVGLVAYWLDAARTPIPILIQASRGNSFPFLKQELDALPRQAGNGNGPKDLKLPAGIDSIFAIEPQNVLRVRGTAAGIEELKKLLVELDVPLSQVEVEAQFCQMSPETLKALPLKFAKNEDTFYAPSVALVPPTISLSAVLNRLIADNKVRVITAPRVTSIDGLNARLMSTEMRVMMLSPDIEKWADMTDSERQWLPGISTVKMETGFNCTPIFHGDVIKLFMRPTLNDRSANVNANLHDGDTIAIAMHADKSEMINRTVVFVTARVVRRAGDEAAQAPKTVATQQGATQLGFIR